MYVPCLRTKWVGLKKRLEGSVGMEKHGMLLHASETWFYASEI